jgi:hypothetical protein
MADTPVVHGNNHGRDTGMADWDQELEGCFGNEDGVFAAHHSDEARAFDWLASLRQRGVGWKGARKQIVAFLSSKNFGKEHRQEQIKRSWRPLL